MPTVFAYSKIGSSAGIACSPTDLQLSRNVASVVDFFFFPSPWAGERTCSHVLTVLDGAMTVWVAPVLPVSPHPCDPSRAPMRPVAPALPVAPMRPDSLGKL